MSLGTRLKEFRDQFGMLQSQVAKEIGIAPSTYAEYETDKKVPRPDKLIKLAEFFNTSTDYLLGRTEEKEPVDRIRYDIKSSTPDLNRILKETAPTWKGKPLTSDQADSLIAFYEAVLKQNKAREEEDSD